MEVKRIFDIPYYSKSKFVKDDYLCDKRNGKWEKISTDEFIKIANQLSRALLRYGLKKGDKIAISTSTNRVEWCFFDQAALQIGLVTVPIYPSISSEDFAYNLENSDSKVCIVSDEKLFEKIKSIKDQLPHLQDIFTFDDVANAKSWKELFETGEADDNQNEVDALRNSISDEELASIIYKAIYKVSQQP